MLARMTDAAPPDADNPPRRRATPWSVAAARITMSISFGVVGSDHAAVPARIRHRIARGG
jgi:hypothetical protein